MFIIIIWRHQWHHIYPVNKSVSNFINFHSRWKFCLHLRCCNRDIYACWVAKSHFQVQTAPFLSYSIFLRGLFFMPHPVYSHLTYIVHLFCLGKLSRPKYQWKLKSWKFYSKMWFWLKNLYLLKQYDAQRLLTELRDKGWKLESIDSLLKRMHETGTFVWQPGSGRQHLLCSSGGPCAQQSGGEVK